MKKSLGVCTGASTIKIVELFWNEEKFTIGNVSVINHECDIKRTFMQEIKKINIESFDYVCITGRKFKEFINLPKITELEATEYALRYYLKNKKKIFNALISLGSENLILYELDKAGNIIKAQTGNKCASGTGEFFLQQIRRMNINLEEAIRLARNSKPYYVSGRCSVFCKTDCTHALNKGIPIDRVCAGLGVMVAEKVLELLRFVKNQDILLVGGGTKNSYVIEKLSEKIKNVVIPEHADIFEALGAAIFAYEKKKQAYHIDLKKEKTCFSTLPALKESRKLVTFKEHPVDIPAEGDEYILGLDVGSTTTKAILLRIKDDKIVASVYLRTNGDPIKASRQCYAELERQTREAKISITGLGVTGSGRKIAGLYALTDGIINEIIAHASAAAFFDKDVDTIIEIGGQDAKYTYLVNGVPCDYAMNEACSAGTGSFLEEAAKESLNIKYLDIQNVALNAKNPVNFNEQCAAFIGSNIKNASHENISKEDIVGGLVYSICMNYNNKVKGQRRLGKKIFMQGGVCYNKAVPLAMASILKKEITVPPGPGLMGAFGVALEIKKRIKMHLMEKSEFNLKKLANAEVEYGKSFVCPGTTEGCDRNCTINIIRVDGKNYPFGGMCNKYYNTLHHLSIDPKPFNIVKERQKLLFSCHREKDSVKKIGISKSFLTNTLYPLYYHFFSGLGLCVILPENIDNQAMKKTCSSFCFPAEISHGMFMALVQQKPDYIFLPHIRDYYAEGNQNHKSISQRMCTIAQAEPYYLQSAFRNIGIPIISPVLYFSQGWKSIEKNFVKIGKMLGYAEDKSRQAFGYALKKQNEFLEEKKALGDKFIKEIEKDKSKIGIVLFGRSYNAFVDEANLGIPRKFASRGFYIIPFDCLRYEREDSIENMNWALGHQIIKASRFVKKHPQLFAVFITNFSCGPDSFITGYFRDIMKTKPSLTLELDSHSADVGINTRIEAFLDIIMRYRQLKIKDKAAVFFKRADLIYKNKEPFYLTSDNELYPLKDARIKTLFPSMGRTVTELAAAAFRGFGFDAEAVPLPDSETLKIGRSNTSCKECLPLTLTTSSLLEYVEKRKDDNELLLYFMPTSSGSCRFAQYSVFLKKLIERKRIKNVALFTLTAKNGYMGLGLLKTCRFMKATITADVMDDIKNTLSVLAADKTKALQIYNKQWNKIISCFESDGKEFYKTLEDVSANLAEIKLKYHINKAKRVLLAGEIYTRKDEFSSQDIVNRLTAKGIIAKRAPVLEWIYHNDYMVRTQYSSNSTAKIKLFLRRFIMTMLEKKIKSILSSSGLYEYELINIYQIIKRVGIFIPAFIGEPALVIGSFFKEIIKNIHGVISVGPFSCMPTRITESILSQESKVAGNPRLNSLENINELRKFHTLPFLSIECDGLPFPQIMEAKIEAFCLQVERLYDAINSSK